MANDHPRIEDAIRAAAARFERAGLAYGHGTDNALDEASWLVCHALGLSPQLAPDYARRLATDEAAAIDALVRERIDTRRPAAYLTGRAWFAGLEFLCDERALIPRSPFAEFLTAGGFGLLPADTPLRVLDLCTGGGCIGIACAVHHPAIGVDASDLSPDALALAAENVALHAVGDRVRLLQGSLFEPADGPYDLILSNPPYVDAADIASMPAEFSHEPAMGLGAGEDGLSLVVPMLEQAAAHLVDDGWLVVEVGNSAAALAARFPELDLAWLDFEGGGDGVFAIGREALVARFGEPER